MNGRMLSSLFLVVAVACSSSAPVPMSSASHTTSAAARGYTPQPGPNPTGVIPVATVHDEKRSRDVEFSLQYPTKAGSYPLIVFSPGFGGSKSGYEGLASYWTSNGYVVIRLSHADTGKVQRLSDARDIWETEKEPQWKNRAADIELILDSLDQLESRFPEIKGKIDRTRIGVAGHSYGAFTAMLIAGMHPTGPSSLDLRDGRVKAVIAMSPQSTGSEPPLSADSWKDVKTPILYMTGSADGGVGNQTDPASRRAAFDATPAGNALLMTIEGARHMSFAGRFSELPDQRIDSTAPPIADPRQYPGSLAGPMETPMPRSRGPNMGNFEKERHVFETIKVASLVFWDAKLKADPKAEEYLNGGLAARGGVMVEKK